MSYTFLDAFSSVQSADSSVISGNIQRPKVDIGSVFAAIPVTFSGASSVSGTVGASVIGLTPVAVTNTPSVTIVGSILAQSAPIPSLISGVTSVITGIASVLVLAAPPPVQRNYISQILVTNAAATGTFVDVIDGGAVIYSGYAAASGGGFSASFNPPLKQPTSVLALYVAPRIQSSIIAAMSGYTAT